MMLFFSQYKKIIALCAIPIAVAVTFFCYQVIHAQSTRTEGQTVNQQMQALLDAELKAAPSDKVLPQSSDFPTESLGPEATSNPAKSIEPDNVTSELTPVTETTKSQTTAKPKRTQKAKATKKPRVTKQPTPTLNPNFRININLATADDLVKLPGIGASKANAIIAYRKQSNAFKTLEELMNVKGIGPKIYEKIKVHLEL